MVGALGGCEATAEDIGTCSGSEGSSDPMSTGNEFLDRAVVLHLSNCNHLLLVSVWNGKRCGGGHLLACRAAASLRAPAEWGGAGVPGWQPLTCLGGMALALSQPGQPKHRLTLGQHGGRLRAGMRHDSCCPRL